MRIVGILLAWLFDCRHPRTSWPRGAGARKYQVCLECGRELPWNCF